MKLFACVPIASPFTVMLILPAQRSNQKLIDAAWLPSLEDKFRLFATAVDKFVAAGYIQIGMDHFALPDDELAISLSQQRLHRNFMGYTTKPAADMIGIGMSAIGDLAACYAQNISKIGSYHTAIATEGLATYRGYHLSQDDLIRRRLITFLMCNFVLPFDLLKREFAIDYHQYFAREDSQLDQFVADGLLERTSRMDWQSTRRDASSSAMWLWCLTPISIAPIVPSNRPSHARSDIDEMTTALERIKSVSGAKSL